MKEYKAGIYLRLSSKKNEENNSIEAQRQITTKYALEKGYKIVNEYVDNGYSGILDTRPALNRMMVDISRGSINMVIVKDISRLTRDKNKTGWYTEIFFPDNDIRFISVTEMIDSGQRYEIDDTIMLRGIANEYYIKDISKKVRANKNAMKEKGQYVESKVPYGYKKFDNDKHKIVIDEKVAGNIRKIYDMYIEGNTSTKIAEYFNECKIETPSTYMALKNASNKWLAEQINDILRNPFYIGDTIVNKYETDYIKKTCKKNTKKDTWNIKKHTHLPIVEREKYDMVQKIKQSKKVSKKIKYQFILKDLVYCGHCKKKLQYKIYKNSSNFNCSLFYKKRCDNSNTIKETELNEIIKSEVIKKIQTIDTSKIIRQIIKYYEENDKTINSLITYKSEIQKLERKKRIIYQKKCDNHITIEEYKTEYLKLKNKVEEYERLIKKNEQSSIKLDKKKAEELFKKLKYQCMSNEFLSRIISRVELYCDNVIKVYFLN